MNSIIVDELTPGMVLAEDIFDCNGRFLIGKGSALTERHVRVLKIWGITEAKVEQASSKSEHAAGAVMLDTDLLQQAEQVMMNKFSHAGLQHEALRELFRVCTLREARRLAQGGGDQAGDIDRFSLKGSGNLYDYWKSAALEADPRGLFGRELKLPALPNIFFQINDVINNPRSSARDIADIIKNDTSLSAKLLRIANSPIHGLASKVDTIPRAVTVIGTKEIGVLALGVTIMTCFRGIPNSIIDMKAFWKHSLACGIAARTIAGFKRISNRERIFTAGLLHDVGRLLLYKYMPDEANGALLQARSGSRFLIDVESEVFGVNHTVIGSMLLKEWRLPVSIESIVGYHHSCMDALAPEEPAIINIADMIVNAMGVGSSGETLVLPLDPKAWTCLGVSRGIFSTVVKQVDRQFGETCRIFLSDE